MTNFIVEGDTFNVASNTPLVSGAVVLMGDIVGVATGNTSPAGLYTVSVCGVYELPKKSADTPAQGAKLYWDATNSELTTTSSSHKLAGYAYEAAISGATIVRCKLLL